MERLAADHPSLPIIFITVLDEAAIGRALDQGPIDGPDGVHYGQP